MSLTPMARAATKLIQVCPVIAVTAVLLCSAFSRGKRNYRNVLKEKGHAYVCFGWMMFNSAFSLAILVFVVASLAVFCVFSDSHAFRFLFWLTIMCTYAEGAKTSLLFPYFLFAFADEMLSEKKILPGTMEYVIGRLALFAVLAVMIEGGPEYL